MQHRHHFARHRTVRDGMRLAKTAWARLQRLTEIDRFQDLPDPPLSTSTSGIGNANGFLQRPRILARRFSPHGL